MEDQVDEIIDFLNDLLNMDCHAISNIINHRVPCNHSLAEHPTVQCGIGKMHGIDSDYTVGMLGILNGLCGTIDNGDLKGYGHITAIVDDDGMIKKFKRTDK